MSKCVTCLLVMNNNDELSFVIHYSFDLLINDDVAFVIGGLCIGLGLGLESCCLVDNTATA